jgi:hypothetical protein
MPHQNIFCPADSPPLHLPCQFCLWPTAP